MQALEQQDGTFLLRFDYDPNKVKMVRILGAEFVTLDGEKVWKLTEPTMVGFVKRVLKEALTNDESFYDLLVRKVRDKIEESQTGINEGLDIPVPDGKRLMTPQIGAVKWMLDHPSTLQADPMGSGKTICCATMANKARAVNVLIICPASVKANWRREWRAWNLMAHNGETTVAIASGNFWPNTNVVIVNFDILDRFRTKIKMEQVAFRAKGKIRKKMVPVLNPDGTPVILREGQIDTREWDLVVIDECHKIKGRRTNRTVAVAGVWSYGKQLQTPITAKRRVAMSGTPIVNRPKEAWPAAYWLWPDAFPNFHLFGMRYCGARKKGKFGWNFDGHSNSEELNIRLRLLGMISRPKEITHAEIPPKSRKIIEYTVHGHDALFAEEEKLAREVELEAAPIRAMPTLARVFQNDDDWRENMRALSGKVTIESKGALRRVRQDIALAAVPRIVDYALEEGEEHGKIVLFCWHKAVANALATALPNSAKITGEVPADARQQEIDRFQNDDECRFFVGTIASCGAGITLTAAKLMLFVEIHDVPGDVMQAEDRIHRKGQLEAVEIRYLVPEGSAMALQAENIIDKMEVIDACTGQINVDSMEGMPVSHLEDDEDMPVATIDYHKLEEYSKLISPTKTYTIRDKLLQIARGRYRRRPCDLDQIVCGRLAGIQNWNNLQRGLANLMVKRYGLAEDTSGGLF